MMVTKGYDVVAAIMDYEGGTLDLDDTIKLFQHLYDTDMIYELQGHYTRTLQMLILAGLIRT